MVKIKQKPAAPELDWSGVDAVIEHEAHPQLAKRIEAFAGDAYGTLVAPGINMIYARIEGETEATMVMVDALANIAGLRANTPIKIYWDRELNNYVWDGKTSIGSYNQATGGATPDTLPQMATYIVQTANTQLPNAQDLDSLSNGMLNKATGGAVSSLAPGTNRNVAISDGTTWTSRALVNADLPVVGLDKGGANQSLSGLTTGALLAKAASTIGAANLTANGIVLGNGTGAPGTLAPGTSGNIAQSNGTIWQSVAPSFNASVIAAGLLALARGGTNADTSGLTTGALIAKGASALEAANLTSAGIVLGNGTGAPTSLAPGTSGNLAQSNGSAWTSTAPSFNASVISAGQLALARGGTNADLSATGGANQFVKQSSAGAAFTVGTIAAEDIPTAVYKWHSNSTDSSVTGTTETSLDTITQFAADFFVANKQIVYEAWGYISTDSNGVGIFRFKLGSVTPTTVNPTITSGSTQFWHLKIIVGCETAGSSGTFWSQATFYLNSTLTQYGNTATDTVNTTVAITPDFTMDFANVGLSRNCTRTNSILTVYNP